MTRKPQPKQPPTPPRPSHPRRRPRRRKKPPNVKPSSSSAERSTRKNGSAGRRSASSSSSGSKRSIEAERNRRAEMLKAREATFDRILENAPPMFTAAQLRVFLRALVNLDPYTFTDDVAEHFAGDNENNQQTAEEILLSTIDGLTDEKLTGFALRLALTGHVAIPRESEFDFLTEAETAFVPPTQEGEEAEEDANGHQTTATKKPLQRRRSRHRPKPVENTKKGLRLRSPFALCPPDPGGGAVPSPAPLP